MATAVYIRQKNGHRVRFGLAHDPAGAAKIKSAVEHWIAKGITLAVADAQGGINEIAPDTVDCVELELETLRIEGHPF